MKRTIFLNENDIRNIVTEVVMDIYKEQSINEGKWGQRLSTAALAALMAGGAIGGGAKLADRMDDITMDDLRLDVPRVEAPQPTYNSDVIDINGDGKLTHDEYVASEYINKHNKDKANDKKPVSRLKKDNVKNKKRDFEASADLIQYIKDYETFHDGWKDDGAGYLTTGWGFKQTPELLQRWPNGLNKDTDVAEADAYLLHYIDSTTNDFISKTPNVKMLPQHVKDALYDLYYNIGPNKYAGSKNLQAALEEYPKTKDLDKIINNLRYGKSKKGVMNGLRRRSTDRQDMALYKDYNREYYDTLKDLKKARNID